MYFIIFKGILTYTDRLNWELWKSSIMESNSTLIYTIILRTKFEGLYVISKEILCIEHGNVRAHVRNGDVIVCVYKAIEILGITTLAPDIQSLIHPDWKFNAINFRKSVIDTSKLSATDH